MSYSLNDYRVTLFTETDGSCGAYIEEIPEVSAYGADQLGALEELKIVFQEWLETAERLNIRG